MIEFNNGIHLLGTGLWFDPQKKTSLSFISSAGVKKFAPPEKVIATPETIKLFQNKFKKSSVLACPYGRPFTLGDIQIELIPSGHILGSAQILINKNGKKYIYAGDINLRYSPTAEPAEIKRCDVLIMKCPYGLSEFDFPPFDDVMSEIRIFIDSCLSSNLVPVLLTEALGKAQDIIKTLDNGGYGFSLHRSIFKNAKLYDELGVRLDNYQSLKREITAGNIVIMPLKEYDSDAINAIKKKRVAAVLEHAHEMKQHIETRYNVDEVFPLSNMADYEELIEYVDSVDPEKVYLVEDNCTEFAQTLQKRGYEAISLTNPSQLKLL